MPVRSGQQPPPPALTPTFQPREEPRSGEPDWAALAEAQDSRARKRRMLMTGGGILAAVAAAVTAFVIVGAGEDKPAKTPGSAGSPAPGASNAVPDPDFPSISPPPPPDPLEIISDAEKDTEPLNTASLFPGERFTLGGRAYAEGPAKATKDCPDVGLKGLAPLLESNGCREMLRATYTRDGVSITVGVAVFDNKKDAETVRRKAVGHIEPLTGKGVGTFCEPVACWSSANAIGRYAYFTMAGFSNNTPVPSTDTKAKQSGRDVSTFAFRQITQRGRAAAGQ